MTPDGRQIYGAVPSQNTVLAFSADTIETPREGLAHAWSGDGTANDQVENIHGELCNGAGFAPGVRGAAFRFDGSDDFAWFGRPRMLLLESGADTFTTWVRFDELDGEMTVADAPAGRTDVGFLIWKGTDHHIWYCPTGRPSESRGSVPVASRTPVNSSSWYHVAVVRIASHVRLFINGALEVEATRPRSVQNSLPSNLILGAESAVDPASRGHVDEALRYRFSHFLKGRIDEVMYYRRALSPEEVRQIYEATKPRSP